MIHGVLILSPLPPCETSKTFGIQIVVTQNGGEIGGTPDFDIWVFWDCCSTRQIQNKYISRRIQTHNIFFSTKNPVCLKTKHLQVK